MGDNMISHPSIFHNIVLRDLFVYEKKKISKCGQRVRSSFPHRPYQSSLGAFYFSFSSGLMISCCWLLTAAGIWEIRVLEKWRRTKGDIEAGDIDSGCHAGLRPIWHLSPLSSFFCPFRVAKVLLR